MSYNKYNCVLKKKKTIRSIFVIPLCEPIYFNEQ